MKKLFGLVLVMLVLSGCAHAPSMVKFDPVVNQNIRTIGLVEVSNPLQYPVVKSVAAEKNQMATGFLLGLFLGIGGVAVAAGMDVGVAGSSARNEAEGILTKEISDSGFNFGRQMTEELAKALRNANYEVVSPSTSNENVKLEVVGAPFVGYRYNGVSGTEVSPLVAANIRLISSNGTILYFSGIAYGEASCSSCFYATKPSEHYNFDLTKPENKALIIEGLQAGIAAIAEKVAADLRK